jgi:hypothetical protein
MSDVKKPDRARLLFLSLVHRIVKKHGGHLDINIEKDTFTVFIPQKRRVGCFQELTNLFGPLELVQESVLTLQ